MQRGMRPPSKIGGGMEGGGGGKNLLGEGQKMLILEVGSVMGDNFSRRGNFGEKLW